MSLILDTNVLLKLRNNLPLDKYPDGETSLSAFLNELIDHANTKGLLLKFLISNNWKFDRPKDWNDYLKCIEICLTKKLLIEVVCDRNSEKWKEISSEVRNKGYISAQLSSNGFAKDPYDIDMLFLFLNLQKNNLYLVSNDFGILNALIEFYKKDILTVNGFYNLIIILGLSFVEKMKDKNFFSELNYKNERKKNILIIKNFEDKTFNKLIQKLDSISNSKGERIVKKRIINDLLTIKFQNSEYLNDSFPNLDAASCNNFIPFSLLKKNNCFNCKNFDKNICPIIEKIQLELPAFAHCSCKFLRNDKNSFCYGCTLFIDFLIKLRKMSELDIELNLISKIEGSPSNYILNLIPTILGKSPKLDPYLKICEYIFNKNVSQEHLISLKKIRKEINSNAIDNFHFVPFVQGGLLIEKNNDYLYTEKLNKFVNPYFDESTNLTDSKDIRTIQIFGGYIIIVLFLESIFNKVLGNQFKALEKDWDRLQYVIMNAYLKNKTFTDSQLDNHFKAKGHSSYEREGFKEILANRTIFIKSKIFKRITIIKEPGNMNGKQYYDINDDVIRNIELIRTYSHDVIREQFYE